MTGWADYARCHGQGHLFFAPEAENRAEKAVRELTALELCDGCPVAAPCDALARSLTARYGTRIGVWGAMAEDERWPRRGPGRPRVSNGEAVA